MTRDMCLIVCVGLTFEVRGLFDHNNRNQSGKTKHKRLYGHITFYTPKKFHVFFIVSVDNNRMFSSELFLSSVLGGFFGGIFIWLLIKILESGKNGLNVPGKQPREHDERQ